MILVLLDMLILWARLNSIVNIVGILLLRVWSVHLLGLLVRNVLGIISRVGQRVPALQDSMSQVHILLMLINVGHVILHV